MPYFLAVTTGPDEGKSCEVDGGSCLIGRSDSAELRLEDESISWEHARVVEEGGKVFLENLSALGTSVRGQKVSGRHRLQPNDEIELSNRCKVKIEIRVTGVTKSSSSGSPTTLIAVVVGAILTLAVIWVLLQSAAGPPASQRQPTGSNWVQAYTIFDDVLGDWVAQGWVSGEFHDRFNEAWRKERAGDRAGAGRIWAELQYEVLTMRAVMLDGRPTFGEVASVNGENLPVYMGMIDDQSPNDVMFKQNERYADGLVWFVRSRARITNPGSEQ